MANAGHLPLNVKTGGRDGLPFGEPIPRWDQRDTKNPRNEIVEDSVSGTVVSNLRPQRRRGEPKARPSRPPVFIRSQEPARAGSFRRLVTSDCWLMTICPRQMVSIVVGRKSSSAAFPPAFYGLYTAFTPVIRSLFSFFSGSLVRLSFMSRVCSLPPFWKVPVHRASLSWYRVASTTSL